MFTNVVAYISAISDHWLFSWGAVALTGIAMLEKWWKPIPKRLFFGLAGALLIIATFQAWDDEHNRAESLKNRVGIATDNSKVAADRVSELEKQLKDSQLPTTKEGARSLRRRTVRLANDLDTFMAERWAKRPVDQEEARKFDQATINLYLSLYKSRTMGVIQELQAKGLDVGLLGAPGAAQSRYLMGDETRQLRDLAYHLDEKGNVVHF
jgi:hypothetical protein